MNDKISKLREQLSVHSHDTALMLQLAHEVFLQYPNPWSLVEGESKMYYEGIQILQNIFEIEPLNFAVAPELAQRFENRTDYNVAENYFKRCKELNLYIERAGKLPPSYLDS